MMQNECYNCGCNLHPICPNYEGEDEMIVKFVKVSKEAKAPVRAHATDAGMDFFYCGDAQIRIDLGGSALIPTGIRMEVPSGYMLEMKNKSGIASRRSLHVGACVVDRGYTGEIFVNLHNVGLETQCIESGEKVAQGVFVRIADYVELLESDSLYADDLTSRGDGALGSTGDR